MFGFEAASTETDLPNARCHSCAITFDVEQFDRITMDPEVIGGKPCIWLSGLFTQRRPQNPSHTYAGNRLTVSNPTRS